MKPNSLFLLLIFVVFLCTSMMTAYESAGDSEKLGQVHFPVSCGSTAQKEFERAVALLHSFWFEEAGKAFTTVIEMDPECAMGYWGVAMSLYHPLWEP
ncbi:MAG: hypothetical protein L0Y56_04640, partial [Nitrospira sp.]|nr:hypothetical protein [Nitrospira sp.]